jgi:hypothetical protein
MKTFKLSRVLYWTAFNGLFAACGYFGLIESVEGARKLFLFACWWCAVVMMVAASTKEIHKKSYERGPSVPRIIGGGFDFAITVTLAWFGFYVTAAAYGIGAGAEHYIFTEPPKEAAPAE